MYKYILKRLLMMIPVLLGVMIAVFSITYFTPGDPARLLLGDGATKEAVEQVHEELGIDDPYIEQLGRYIGKIVFHFDFGTSYISKTRHAGNPSAFPHHAEAGIVQCRHFCHCGRTHGYCLRHEAVFDF